MIKWKPSAGFPTAEQVARMVAAEVKHLAEAEYQRQKSKEVKVVERRDRLRTAYRRYIPSDGRKVDFDAVRRTVENVAGVTLAAWRRLSHIDELALAESTSRADLDDLEFLVTRSLGELNGVKNLLALARRLA